MPSYKRLFLTTFLLLSLSGHYAHADETAVDIPPPPVIPDISEERSSIKADVVIRKGKDKVIEEYRISGKLYMVRIIPTIGKPYYLKYPEGESGRVIRGDLEDIKTPFWKLFEW